MDEAYLRALVLCLGVNSVWGFKAFSVPWRLFTWRLFSLMVKFNFGLPTSWWGCVFKSTSSIFFPSCFAVRHTSLEFDWLVVIFVAVWHNTHQWNSWFYSQYGNCHINVSFCYFCDIFSTHWVLIRWPYINIPALQLYCTVIYTEAFGTILSQTGGFMFLSGNVTRNRAILDRMVVIFSMKLW